MSGAVLNNIFPENFLQIIIKAFVAYLFLVKPYAFTIFLWNSLDEYVWIMKIVIVDSSYFTR